MTGWDEDVRPLGDASVVRAAQRRAAWALLLGLLAMGLTLLCATVASAQSYTLQGSELVVTALPSRAGETDCLWVDAGGRAKRGACSTAGTAAVGANLIFAGPASGGSALPTFRSLVDADIPNDLTLGTISGTPTFTGAATFNSTVQADISLGAISGRRRWQTNGTGISGLAADNSWVSLTIGPLSVMGSATVSGDLAVDGGDLTSSAATLNLNSNGTIHSVDAHTFAADAGTADFASQTTGWRITEPGYADVRGLFTNELRALRFVSDLEEAWNGSFLVTKSSTPIGAAFTCPAAGATAPLTVKDLPSAPNLRVFSVNDWVVLRHFARSDADADGATDLTIGDCVGQVSSYADGDGTQQWTFTRGSGGNAGGLAASTVIPVDTIAVNFGVSGMGAAEISAVDGAEGANAPYFQIKRWTSAPVAANFTVPTRLGQLRGITDTDEHGLLAGAYAATAGKYFRASNQNFDLHGITLKLWDADSVNLVLDPGASSQHPYLGIGNPAPTSYASGTGIWFGSDGGTYKGRIGNPSGDRITWDGTNLTVVGTLTVTGGNAATQTYAQTVANTAESNATAVANTKETPTGAQAKADTAYSNATSWSSADATSKANTAQSTAISTASGDATTKANTAYSNAVSWATTNRADTSLTNVLDATVRAKTAWGHASNATLIDGGDIYTGSIYADSIAANAITATKISSDALNSRTITGSTLQTAASCGSAATACTVMTSSGLRTYSSAPSLGIEIDHASGIRVQGASSASDNARQIYFAGTPSALYATYGGQHHISVEGTINIGEDQSGFSSTASKIMLRSDSGSASVPQCGDVNLAVDATNGTAGVTVTSNNCGSAPSNANVSASGFHIPSWPTWNLATQSVCTTAGTGGAGFIFTYGGACASQSSERIKKEVLPESLSAAILDLAPVSFRYTWEDDAAPRRVGVIAERVADLGLEFLVIRDAEGQVSGVHYDRMALYLIPLVKAQQAQIEALERRLSALEAGR